MNYYAFHIGDFRSGTVNMTRLARWIYRDMLDVYYDTEHPLTLDFDALCNEIGVEVEDERRIVERLLRFKFDKTDDGYRNATCERVIAEYHTKAETARTNGKLGGRPRKPKKTDDKPTGFQSGSNQDAIGNQDATGSQANQEPRTNNQEPKEKIKPTAPPNGAAIVAYDEGDRRKQPRSQSLTGGDAVDEVFYYWQLKMDHPQAKLDAKRRKAISGRLKDGYTVGDLCRAVDGCKLSPHHMGQNQSRTVYDDIELICRDGTKVDGFIARVRNGVPSMSPGMQQQVDILNEWMQEVEDGKR